MKKESKRHILSTVAVILAAVAAVTVLFVLHHKQQQEKARQPEESVSQAEDDTIEWNGKRYTYNNNQKFPKHFKKRESIILLFLT